jgi:hypothetical protein
MGWKLAGIAINKNYSDNHQKLFDTLGIKNPKLKKQMDFEDGTSEFLEDGNIIVGFFGNGTFISSDTTLMTNDDVLTIASLNKRICAFYVYETTSTYCFDYFENGKYIRRKWYSDTDESMVPENNFGDELDIEKTDTDPMEIVLNLIGDIIQKRFYDIDEQDVMFHYEVEYGQPIPEKTGFFKKFFN